MRVDAINECHRKMGETGDTNGYFLIPFEGRYYAVIISDGMGWDHVSVSLPNRIPGWSAMCFIKNTFFDENEAVVQFHPPKKDYINNHPHCLHLWKKQGYEFPLPNPIMVGIKE